MPSTPLWRSVSCVFGMTSHQPTTRPPSTATNCAMPAAQAVEHEAAHACAAAAPRGTQASAARGRRRRAPRENPRCGVARSERSDGSCPCRRPAGCILRPPADLHSGGPRRVLRMPPVLYLVDASVFIFRAYYSVPLEFTDRDGNPVNAVHGFARFLGDLLERESPAHIAVAFDESLEQSYRNEIYPAYKANREPAPAELKRQFGLCRELVRAHRPRRVRQLALRGRRHHRHARDARPRGGPAGDDRRAATRTSRSWWASRTPTGTRSPTCATATTTSRSASA